MLRNFDRRLKAVQPKTRVSGASQTTMAPFKGVTEVEVAPVSLGNTVRSMKQSVTQSGDMVRVVGRDYVSAIGGTSTSFSGWTFQSGLGLSPIALNASGLRGFFQTFEMYKWNRVVAHYITSSPTSLAGDILLMYHSNHGGPKVDHSSTNFLSYALSTDSALIGPQWTNHSIEIIRGPHQMLNTDVLNAEDVQHQADGELLVYTKNTTNGSQADSPGYLLIDYDVTFARRMLNPRVQTLPSSLFKWQPFTFHLSPGPVLAGATVSFDMASTGTYNGATTTLPAGVVIGDIFQVVFDTINAAIARITFATGFAITLAPGVTQVYPITNGCTLYAVCASAVGSGSFALHANYDAALTGVPMVYSANATPVVATPLVMCCVGSVTPQYQQASIG